MYEVIYNMYIYINSLVMHIINIYKGSVVSLYLYISSKILYKDISSIVINNIC